MASRISKRREGEVVCPIMEKATGESRTYGAFQALKLGWLRCGTARAILCS
jgi:hypothetical protein